MSIFSDEFYYQPLKIDSVNTQVYSDFTAKEGDANGRGLLVTLTENGVIKDTTGISLNLKWEHPAINAQGLDDFEPEDLTKGLYKITYPTEMLHKGKVRAFIQIIDSGKIVGSRNIKIMVEATVGNDAAIESSNSFTALASALISVQNLESTYAPELNSVKQQLAQTAFTKTEVYSDFSDDINGTVTALDSGQTVINFGNTPMRVESGLLIHDSWPNSANGSAYLQTQLPSKVTRMGGEFVIPSGADGMFVLVAPRENWATDPGLENAGIHTTISRNDWSIGMRIGGANVSLLNGVFNPPLVADGLTKYKFDVSVDHATSTTFATLPNGVIKTVTDSRISDYMSDYVVWELYENNPDYLTVRKNPVKIASIWASHINADAEYNKNVVTVAELTKQSNALLNAVPKQVYPAWKLYNPTTMTIYDAPTTAAVVDATNLKVTAVPSTSGKVLIEVTAYVQNTVVDAIYFWGLQDSLGAFGLQRLVVGPTKQIHKARWIREGMSNGVARDIMLTHGCTILGPQLKCENGSGMHFIMTATPL